MRKLRCIVLCVLVGTTGASVASAQRGARADRSGSARADATPADVGTAEQLYAKLDYEKANDVAERVTRRSGLTHDQLVRAYRVLAVTDAILDRPEQARDAFLKLLVIEPEYTVDTNLGPKVSTPFVEARGQYRSLPSKPGVEVTANVREDGGQLRVTTRDPTHIAKKVTVGYRWRSTGGYTVTTSPVGEGTVEVSAAPPGRTRLDYYAIATDDRDNVVFEAGTPEVPRSAFAEAAPRATNGEAPPEKKRSIFASPVFWLVAGAVVAGGGAAAYFATRPSDPTKASLSPQIRCGNDLCQ